MGLGATPVSYETVMHDTGRAFNPDFEASDHQKCQSGDDSLVADAT